MMEQPNLSRILYSPAAMLLTAAVLESAMSAARESTQSKSLTGLGDDREFAASIGMEATSVGWGGATAGVALSGGGARRVRRRKRAARTCPCFKRQARRSPETGTKHGLPQGTGTMSCIY